VNSVVGSDGLHLNPEGAVLFTSALARDLPERVVAQDALTSLLVPECPFPCRGCRP
jgi:hypothetical protein